MTAVLADFEKETGVSTWVQADSDDRLHLITRQDVEPILDLNKAQASMGRSGYAIDSDMWHVARVPNWVIIKWLNDHGVNFYAADHRDHVKRLLNAPEWAWLRTGGGRL